MVLLGEVADTGGGEREMRGEKRKRKRMWGLDSMAFVAFFLLW